MNQERSFDSRAKDAKLPYCASCGGEMRPNVPRMGWDGGAVHVANSGLSCPPEALENSGHPTPVRVGFEVVDKAPRTKQLKRTYKFRPGKLQHTPRVVVTSNPFNSKP